MPRIHGEPQALTLHKRVEALTKRVEKLDREVFKAIRIDAENCMPPEEEIRLAVAEEARQAVIRVLVELGVLKPAPPQEPAA